MTLRIVLRAVGVLLIVARLLTSTPTITPEAARDLLAVAVQVGEERRELLHRLRASLVQGDDREALRLARVLTGLEADEQ